MKNSVDFTYLRVVLIGAFPPPVSGNSVHIARLYHLLKEKGHWVKVLDYMGKHTIGDPSDVTRLTGGLLLKSLQVLRFMITIPHGTIVHFHVSALGRFRWLAPMLILLTIGHKRVITIHSGSFMAGQTKTFKRVYFRTILSFFCTLIAVSQEIRDSVISLGIRSRRIIVIPAFIKEDSDQQFLPQGFYDIPSESIKVITSGTLYRIYNYELLIEVIRKINPKKFHFIFAFYKYYDKEYEKEIIDKLKEHSNISIFRDLSPAEFLAVLSSSDIYVRSTFTDGDSVAVREALALGKTVYATNYVVRPQGCVEFRYSDELLNFLNDWTDDQKMKQSQKIEEIEKLLQIYTILN